MWSRKSGIVNKERSGQPWYELYDGDKPLIAGHHDYLSTAQPFIYRDRVFCIDTGCCQGRALTGLMVPDFRLVTVPSRKNYWKEIQSQHIDLRYTTTPDQIQFRGDTLTLNEALELRKGLNDRIGELHTQVVGSAYHRVIYKEGRDIVEPNELSYAACIRGLEEARLAFRELNRKLRAVSFEIVVDFRDEA